MYPATDVCRLFFGPSVHVKEHVIRIDTPKNLSIESTVHSDGSVITTLTGTDIVEKPIAGNRLPPNREIKRQLYRILSKINERDFPWGSLTGIRPTFVAGENLDVDALRQMFDVREDKAKLALFTAKAEERVLASTNRDDLFVYIGIPFCPSRCSYCSFITEESQANIKLLPNYLDALQKEVIGLADRFKNVRAVYFGGGTPTIPDNDHIRKFVRGCLDIICPNRDAEITMEAGRPDTLTEAKIETLRNEGGGRICVNPQTLSDKTLSEIGRRHTAEQFYTAYEWAKKAGFSVINTDLIAGLPTETMEEFRFSMDQILKRAPENITIHALSKKRTASMSRNDMFDEESKAQLADEMVSYAAMRLGQEGYQPYYLYKQKDTIGALENTGYSKPGKECLYNVAMMSDCREVLSLGAGGVSKRIRSDGRSKRHYCPKNPAQYIERIEEVIRGKNLFFEV